MFHERNLAQQKHITNSTVGLASPNILEISNIPKAFGNAKPTAHFQKGEKVTEGFYGFVVKYILQQFEKSEQ